MNTNKEIEDLSDSKGERGGGKHDQWSSFAEDLEDDKAFEDEIYDETNEREQEIEDVECEVFQRWGDCVEGGRPSEACVGGDEAYANEEDQRGPKDELQVRTGQRGKGKYPH